VFAVAIREHPIWAQHRKRLGGDEGEMDNGDQDAERGLLGAHEDVEERNVGNAEQEVSQRQQEMPVHIRPPARKAHRRESKQPGQAVGLEYADRQRILVQHRGIRTVGSGQSLLDPAVTRQVLDRLRRGKHLQDEKLALLSPQEERILALVAEGKTNGQIGAEMNLAEKTVKNYVSSILGKLEVVRRSEAAAYLARHTSTPGR
jgi:DNA-binding NarL/FixJ family response regulator